MSPARAWLCSVVERVASWLVLSVPKDDLVPGTAYVWLVPGPRPLLTVGELVSVDAWVEPAYLPGEAMVLAFGYAVMEDSTGHRRTVRRSDVLWPAADHAAIRSATRTLGVPVVPHVVRGAPSWRLGRVRLDVADMVELGRLVPQH